MIQISKPYITADEAQAAYDTILTGWITQGPRVSEFEDKFAKYIGSEHAIAVSNCTTALHLAMIVAGVRAGDEVICPSMSYIASANSIVHAGGTPVFAEVSRKSYNMDIEDVRHRINERTKAILLVHQIGMPADIAAYKELCQKYDLILIEDAACAIGSEYMGEKIGSHSDLVCFSLHPRKVISTGDGGMITTSNPEYNERLRLLRQHGMSVNDRVRHEANTKRKIIFEDHLEIGYNYRMTDIQASVGIKQLEKLDWIIEKRREIAKRYISALSDIDSIILPLEEENYKTNYQSFSIYIKPECSISRNEIMQRMLDQGISTRRGIMTTHRETAYKNICSGLSLPVSEDASDRSILIPLYVPMEESDIEKVISVFRSIVLSN